MQKAKIVKLVLVLFIFSLNIIFGSMASAAVTVPWKFVYEGRLLDSTGNSPMTTSHTFRFSFWKVSAVAPGDMTAGVIDTFAVNYGGWDEFQIVTPNVDGFFSLELGATTPLPTIDYTSHLYLQVEVKPSGAPDSAYEVLDRAPADALSDRSPIGTVPYSMNSDKIDNAELGTSTGDIVTLGAGDVWPVSTIPGGTDAGEFVIDAGDAVIAGQIDLQFGGTLFKTLSWDIGNDYFNFNDDVNIQGDLTLTGTVDGVDIAIMSNNISAHLDGGASKHDATEIDVEAIDGHYYSAGDLEIAIDDLDEAINSVAGGSAAQNIVLTTAFSGATFVEDGSNNIGRLIDAYDAVAGRNHYVWSSTRSSGLQDYDIVMQIPLPTGFVSWNGATPWTFNYRSTNANNTENKADIFVYDTAGNLVTLAGTSTGLANVAWASTAIGYLGTPTFTAGETFVIVVRVYAQNKEEIHLGEVILDFTGT